MGVLFTWVVIVLGLSLAVFGLRAVLRWQGAWRCTALLPLLIVLGVTAWIMIDVRADPTAHNLWPFKVLAAVIAASILLGILELIRRVRLKDSSRQSGATTIKSDYMLSLDSERVANQLYFPQPNSVRCLVFAGYAASKGNTRRSDCVDADRRLEN